MGIYIGVPLFREITITVKPDPKPLNKLNFAPPSEAGFAHGVDRRLLLSNIALVSGEIIGSPKA